MLDIHIEETEEYTLCRPSGELDAYTVGAFREALSKLAGHRNLLIDLSFILSICLRSFILYLPSSLFVSQFLLRIPPPLPPLLTLLVPPSLLIMSHHWLSRNFSLHHHTSPLLPSNISLFLVFTSSILPASSGKRRCL